MFNKIADRTSNEEVIEIAHQLITIIGIYIKPIYEKVTKEGVCDDKTYDKMHNIIKNYKDVAPFVQEKKTTEELSEDEIKEKIKYLMEN